MRTSYEEKKTEGTLSGFKVTRSTFGQRKKTKLSLKKEGFILKRKVQFESLENRNNFCNNFQKCIQN